MFMLRTAMERYSEETLCMRARAIAIIEAYQSAGGHVSADNFALSFAEMKVGTSVDPTGARYAALKAKWHVILAAEAMTAEEDAQEALATAEATEVAAASNYGLTFAARAAREWAQSCLWVAKDCDNKMKKWLQDHRPYAGRLIPPRVKKSIQTRT